MVAVATKYPERWFEEDTDSGCRGDYSYVTAREVTALFHSTDMLVRINGRGQPLSFTLSFGETPWFDEEGEIRRCDWSGNAFLCMCLVWITRLWVRF